MYHNAIKQNPSFYAKSYPYKTHVCTTNDRYPSYLLLMLSQVSVRYSVDYKHHKALLVSMYRIVIL